MLSRCSFISLNRPCCHFRDYATVAKQGIKKRRKRTLKDLTSDKNIRDSYYGAMAFQGPKKTLFDPELKKMPDEVRSRKASTRYGQLFPMEDEVPNEYEGAMADLDFQYNLVKKQVAVALQDPDVILYEAVLNNRIKQLELKWVKSPEPISQHSYDKLNKERDRIIFEVEVEFDKYFEILPSLTKEEIKEYRQEFLDEIGGVLKMDLADCWKNQFLLPEYDLTKHPLSPEEEEKLFLGDGMVLENSPQKLYSKYEKLFNFMPDQNRVALKEASSDRILAHLEHIRHEKKAKELDKSDEQAEKDDAQVEKDMLVIPGYCSFDDSSDPATNFD